MKKGKIIILVILVAVITSIITVIVINGTSVKSEKAKNEEIIESKKVTINWIYEKHDYINITFLKLLNNQNSDEKLIGIVSLISEVEKMEKEIDNSVWCKTSTLAYNSNCIAYKEEIKKILSTHSLLLKMTVIAIVEPENKENSENISLVLDNKEENEEAFLKKTREFINKEYY